MKKLLACLLIACTSLATLSSCSMDSLKGTFDTVKDKVTSVVDTVKDKVDELLGKTEEYDVEKALDLVDSMYVDKVGAGRVDYEVSNSVMIGSTKYTVAWSVDVAEDVVKLVVGEESTKVVVSKVLTADTDYKLTATVTAPDGTTGSIYFNGTVLAMPSIIPELISAKPVEGTEYKLYVWQDNKKVDCYFNGKVASSFYFGSVENHEEGVTVYVEYVEGSDTKFNMYFMDEFNGNVKTYIGVKENWNTKKSYWSYNVTMSTEAPVSQFEYSEEYKTIVTTVPACSEDKIDATQDTTKTFYLGANGTYTTISAYDVTKMATATDTFVGGLAVMADASKVSAADKVAHEKDVLSVDDKHYGDKTVELTTYGSRYADVAISWTEDSDNVTIADGVMTITAPAANATFTLTATFTCGDATDTKEFTITIGPKTEIPEAGSTLTIAQAVAIGSTMEHDTYTEGKYYVTGVVQNGVNTTYGNMTIKDENGDSIYVYGTYDADGTNRYDAMENAPVAGDTVTLYGPIGNYIGVQMKNAWITNVVPGEGLPTIEPPAPDSTMTIADAAELGASMSHDTTTEGKYYVTGVIDNIANTQYGNFTIKDTNGNSLYIYGSFDVDGTNRYDAMGDKAPQVGDTVKLYGVIGNYNGAQMKNAWIMEINGVALEPVAPPTIELPADGSTLTIAEAVELAKKVTATTEEKYYVTGVVQPGLNSDGKGSMTITDENGDSIAVYKSNYADLATKPAPGDTVTVYGALGNFNGAAQIQEVEITEVVAGSIDVSLPEAGVSYYLSAFDTEAYAESYITGTNDNKDILTVGAKEDAITVTFEAVDDVTNGYKIKLSTGEYVNAASSGNKLSISETAETVWVIDLETMSIKQNGTNYSLQYNASSPRISRYTSTQKGIWFTALEEYQLTIVNYNPLGSYFDPENPITYNVTLTEGSAINVPTIPTIEGATFKGFVTISYDENDNEIVTPATIPATITADVTVWAQWEVTPYTVTLVYDDGTKTEIKFGSIGDYNNGITPISDMNVWTLEGYLPEKGEYEYSIVEEIPETFELKDYTFNVSKKVAQYQFTIVNYNPTASMWDTENPRTYNVTLDYGSAISYTDPVDQPGLKFLGYVMYQYNFETWEEEEVEATIPETLTEDVTVYAKWEVEEFTVTVVYPEGYTPDSELVNPIKFGAISVWEDGIVAVSDLAWTLGGYLPEADENYKYVWAEEIPETFELKDYTFTIEAKDAFTLTIRNYNPLGNPFDFQNNSTKTFTIAYGETVAVENPANIDGATFSHYINLAGEIVTLPETLEEDTALFAVWNVTPYTLTIDHIGEKEDEVVKFGVIADPDNGIDLVLADVGYMLNMLLPAETDDAVYSYAEEIPAEFALQDYTFTVVETAKYDLTIRNYNPTAMMMDPTATLLLTLTDGSKVDVTLPTYAGCEFVEYQDIDGNVVSLPETLTADFTAYAIWNFIPYTVTITYPEAYTAEKTESITFAAKAEGNVMITNNDLPFVIADIVLADGYSFKSVPETFALENITLEVEHNCVLGTVDHTYAEDTHYCVCGKADPDHYFVMTIPQVLAATVGEKVEVSGTVSGIYEAWSSYNNMSVYIKDAEDNSLLVFRFKTEVKLGDIITVKGVIGEYNDVNQIAAGATITVTDHDTSYDVVPEYTIPEALDLADGTSLTVTGTVVEINSNYTTAGSFTSAYIADENGTRIYCFKLTGDVTVNQIIKVTGTMGSYNGTKQIAAGAKFELLGTHECSKFSDATCTKPAACLVCGNVEDETLLPHNYVDGVCACGDREGVQSTTIAITFSETPEIATDKAIFSSYAIDSVVTLSGAQGTHTNTKPTYYTNGNAIRFYKGNTLTLACAEGYVITSITITYSQGTITGYASGTEVVISNPASSLVIDTFTATTRIQSISVTYQPAQAN